MKTVSSNAVSMSDSNRRVTRSRAVATAAKNDNDAAPKSTANDANDANSNDLPASDAPNPLTEHPSFVMLTRISETQPAAYAVLRALLPEPTAPESNFSTVHSIQSTLVAPIRRSTVPDELYLPGGPALCAVCQLCKLGLVHSGAYEWIHANLPAPSTELAIPPPPEAHFAHKEQHSANLLQHVFHLQPEAYHVLHALLPDPFKSGTAAYKIMALESLWENENEHHHQMFQDDENDEDAERLTVRAQFRAVFVLCRLCLLEKDFYRKLFLRLPIPVASDGSHVQADADNHQAHRTAPSVQTPPTYDDFDKLF